MNICVFGSSSELIDKEFLLSAEHFGETVAQKGHTIIFGAGKYGVMGAVARGVTKNKGELIGVTPTFFEDMKVVYEQCTETVYTKTMRERKGIMEERADAFVICAGGIGTYEEFFEVLTLKELGRHAKPIIIYNVNGYYDPMIALLENTVKEKFIKPTLYNLFSVANTEEQVFQQIENASNFEYDKYDFLSDKEN